MTKLENCLSQDLKRYYLQGKGARSIWLICDRDNKNKVAVRIYGKPMLVQKILDLMNKEDGYLD